VARSTPDKPEVSAAKVWSKRLAWGVLTSGVVLIGVRVAIATVVRVHGDGMAPALVDGEHVLLLRGQWSIERGDVVVYAASIPAPATAAGNPVEPDAPRSRSADGREFPDARRPGARDLRNTAVVDPETFGDEIDENWRKVQARADAGLGAVTAYRVGRVLAQPGDRVTLVRERDGIGLVVEGASIEQKPGPTMHVATRDGANGPRRTLWEQSGERRYLVLDDGTRAADWRRLADGQHEGEPIVAPGYLILADNRDEGRCCDSRALGWIDPESVRGEVLARLASGPADTTPPDDPSAAPPSGDDGEHAPVTSRGMQWKP
jgi:signal peptidase I